MLLGWHRPQGPPVTPSHQSAEQKKKQGAGGPSAPRPCSSANEAAFLTLPRIRPGMNRSCSFPERLLSDTLLPEPPALETTAPRPQCFPSLRLAGTVTRSRTRGRLQLPAGRLLLRAAAWQRRVPGRERGATGQESACAAGGRSGRASSQEQLGFHSDLLPRDPAMSARAKRPHCSPLRPAAFFLPQATGALWAPGAGQEQLPRAGQATRATAAPPSPAPQQRGPVCNRTVVLAG